MTFKYINKSKHKIPLDIDPMNAGVDIRSDENYILWPGQQKLIATNIHLLCDAGEAFIFKERSGLAAKRKIEVHAGLIDPAFVKPVFVVLKNAGWLPFRIKRGDRIAQFIMVRVEHALTEVNSCVDNARIGFGSTGIK